MEDVFPQAGLEWLEEQGAAHGNSSAEDDNGRVEDVQVVCHADAEILARPRVGFTRQFVSRERGLGDFLGGRLARQR